MKRQILLEQMNDRVLKGLAVEIDLYKQLISGDLTDADCDDLIETAEGLTIIFKAMVDIYRGNSEQYEELIYKFAKECET